MRLRLLFAIVLGLAVVVGAQQLTGCAEAKPLATSEAPQPVVVLISIDGFRYDYLDRDDADTPTLDRLAREGVRADLVPVYPTKTFPNHYSLVTGLHPEAHGIVNNTMRDPERLIDGKPARFSLANREAVRDGAWWGGEPIWATAQRQGQATAVLFWPGSEAPIGGVLPTHGLPYNGDMPYADRVDWVLEHLGGEDRPTFATLYFEGVDTAGHRHGPDAPETADAIEAVDVALGRLVDGLAEQGRLATTDLVVVSDHGMAAVAPERRVYIDDAIDIEAVDEVMWGETAGVWPGAADADSLVARIDALPHVRAFRREDTPPRLRYRDHPRIPPVVVIPDVGWTVTSRAFAARAPDRPSGGAHGYDNRPRSMHGAFVASGPRVRVGEALGPFSVVDVYGILAEALGIEAAPNDGDPYVAERVLR
ncbi:MAG: ectonucleotide pyrophosphatase/phosphodiesterase [Bacteroidota bacterium]